MKKALVLLITCAFTICSTGQSDPHSRRQHVIDAVGYPSHLDPSNAVEVVLVTFQIEADGNLTVVEANASNTAYQSYVLQTITKLEFHGMEKAERHSVKFSFVKR